MIFYKGNNSNNHWTLNYLGIHTQKNENAMIPETSSIYESGKFLQL